MPDPRNPNKYFRCEIGSLLHYLLCNFIVCALISIFQNILLGEVKKITISLNFFPMISYILFKITESYIADNNNKSFFFSCEIKYSIYCVHDVLLIFRLHLTSVLAEICLSISAFKIRFCF